MENYVFRESDLIGTGSFGKVYKGRRRETGQITAMKFIVKRGKSKKDIDNLRQEIRILRDLKHENIIQMLDTFETESEFCVVTEFAQGELFQILEDDKMLPEVVVQKIAKQLTRALHYLHFNSIIHRDMKPQNILIGTGGTVKLCDFGFARSIKCNDLVKRSIKGTPLYMAPELYLEKAYNRTVDHWSLGIILYELFVGKPPFYNTNFCSLMSLVVNNPIEFPPHISDEFKDFLTGLLNKKPENRLDWPDLENHPFVRESESERLEREQRLADAAEHARASRAWKGEGGAIAGAAVYSGTRSGTPMRDPSALDRPARDPSASPSRLTAKPKLLRNTPPIGARSADENAAHPNGMVKRALLERPPAGDAAPDGHSGGLIKAAPAARAVDVLAALLDNLGIDNQLKHGGISSASVAALYNDPDAVKMLLQALRAPAARTIARWAPSDHLMKAVYVTGEMLANHPLGRHSTELQRALTKAVVTMVSSNLTESAASVLHTLVSAEARAGANGGFLSFQDTPEHYASLISKSDPDVGGMWQVITEAALGLQGVLQRLNATYFSPTPGRLREPAIQIMNALQQTIALDLCVLLQKAATSPERTPNIDKSVVAVAATNVLACMMHLVHTSAGSGCVSRRVVEYFPLAVVSTQPGGAKHAPLNPDMSPHMFVQRKQVAQKLMENLRAVSFLVGMVTGTASVQHMALVILMHASWHSPTLSVHLVKHGLVARLLEVVRTTELAAVDEARCFRILAFLLEHAQDHADLRSNEIRGSLALDAGPVVLTKALVERKDNTALVSTILYALARYCYLLDQPVIKRRGFTMPACCYSPATLAAAAAVGAQPTGEFPALEETEGLPCRTGLLDGPMALLDSLCPSQVAKPAFRHSALVTWFFHTFAGPQELSLDLSPRGVSAGIHALSVVSGTDGGVEVLAKVPLVGRMLSLMGREHLAAMLLWPTCAGGNRGNGTKLVEQVASVLQHPFFEAEELLQKNVEVYAQKWKSVLLLVDALAAHNAPRVLISAIEEMTAADCCMTVQLLGRVVMTDNSSHGHKFALQYIEAGGLKPSFLQKMLRESNPVVVLVRTLLLISHLARAQKHEGMRMNYELIHQADIYTALRKLFSHRDPAVRMRVCNLVGNLCKHSDFFYRYLSMYNLIQPIIDRCNDSDPTTRKFACFAFGNAAFHSNMLYSTLENGIPRLVELLADQDRKTMVNAAGALGNLVRNGPELVKPMLEAGGMEAMLDMAITSGQDPNAIGIALFSLGNMANHALMWPAMEQAQVEARVARLLEHPSNDVQIKCGRLLKKIREHAHRAG